MGTTSGPVPPGTGLRRVRVRPIRPDDEQRLADFHARLSPDSIRRRFFNAHPVLSPKELDRFTHVDGELRLAVVAAGRAISVSGGHGDGRNGLNREVAGTIVTGNVCNGPEDCRRAVREQISQGADVIKFMATGGVLSNVAGGLNQQMMDDEMRAVIETARAFGRKTAAHAHGVDGINAALRAGVNSIEHGTFTNEETFRLYKQTSAYYVPTLLAPAAALADGVRGALTDRRSGKSGVDRDHARLHAGYATSGSLGSRPD